MHRTRGIPIQIRVTEGEKRRLQRNARACRMSLSAYLRTVGLGKKLQPLPMDELYTLYRGLLRLRSEYQHQDPDWIERQFDALTEQFYKVCTAGGDDGSYEDLAH